MIYKVNYSEGNPQRGRKPSNFRVKVDRTLAVMEPNSNFTIWNKVGMTTEQLQKTLSAYVCFYQDKNYGKKFSTKKYSHGVKITREW
jgi:hypothetical protein